jgi:LysR family transcriptional regulator, mexEF-oprN operon transcriptional activator
MSLRTDGSGLRRIDLNLLPVFLALMRERGVTRAGKALFLSQPATSAALARLRAAFRDPLFVPGGRAGLVPTPRAEALLAELEPALRAIAGAVAGATPFDPAADARTFRVGWSDDVAIAAMPLLRRLREAAPHCRLVIRAANFRTIPAMLDSGEIGTAVGFMADDLPAGAKQRVLRRGGFRVLRDAASPGPVDLDAYCARPHVLVTPRGDLVGFADAVLARLGRSRRVVIGLPDFGMLRRVLLGTDLLCTVSDALSDVLVDVFTEGGLASDPLPFEAPTRSAVRMAWRAALDHDPAEMWLRAQIVETLAARERR